MSFTAANGDTVNIDLLEDRLSAPSSVARLPVLRESKEIEWQFSDQFGQGVLSRQFEIALALYQGNNIASLILSNPLQYKLKITSGSKKLFEGRVVDFDDQKNFEIQAKNPSTGFWTNINESEVRILFSDSISNDSHPTLSQLKGLVASSTNPIHQLDQVPLSDLISEFVYEKILHIEERFISAHSLYFKTFSPNVDHNVWMHRVLLDIDSLETSLSMVELFKSICYVFNLNIGYSHTFEAIAAFDNNLLDLGSNPFTDDGEQVTIDLYSPAYLDKVSSGIRDVDPTIVELQTVELREDFSSRLIKSDRNKRLTIPAKGFVTFRGLSDKTVPLGIVGRFNNSTTAATGIDHSDVIRPNYTFYGNSGIEASNPFLKYILDTAIAGPVDFWSSIQKSIIHFNNAERFNLLIDGYIDPMLPIRLVSNHQTTGLVTKCIKGRFNIYDATTYLECLQIGNISPGLGNRLPGVNYNNWQYFDPSYLAE